MGPPTGLFLYEKFLFPNPPFRTHSGSTSNFPLSFPFSTAAHVRSSVSPRSKAGSYTIRTGTASSKPHRIETNVLEQDSSPTTIGPESKSALLRWKA